MNESERRDAAVAGTRALIEHEQRMIQAYVQRELVQVPPGSHALMIGPHPDDNLLGAGGSTMALHEAGERVEWLCVTDGRACIAPAEERRAMAERRLEEERRCAEFLGVADLHLLAIEEDRLLEGEPSERAVAAIARLLENGPFDCVYVPWVLDTHPLHRYCAHLAAHAMERAGYRGAVHSWAIGSFLPPRLIVDITRFLDRKQEAMRCYASQLAFRDYLGEMRDLHHLQASYSPQRVDFAELLHPQTAEEFRRLVESMALDDPRTLACGPQPMVAEES